MWQKQHWSQTIYDEVILRQGLQNLDAVHHSLELNMSLIPLLF
jgi:hypothetical protein